MRALGFVHAALKGAAAEEDHDGDYRMWVTGLNVFTLLAMIAVLAYVSSAARRIDQGLAAMLSEQGDRLRRMERDLDRVRQSVDSIGTTVMTIDVRQRMKK